MIQITDDFFLEKAWWKLKICVWDAPFLVLPARCAVGPYLDETAVERQVVSDGVLPGSLVGSVVGESPHDELIDAGQSDPLVGALLDSHGYQSDVADTQTHTQTFIRWNIVRRKEAIKWGEEKILTIFCQYVKKKKFNIFNILSLIFYLSYFIFDFDFIYFTKIRKYIDLLLDPF